MTLLIVLGRRHETLSIFKPSRSDVRVPDEFTPKPDDILIDTGDGVIHGWFFETNREAPTLLYIHGNADTIVQRLPVIKGYISLGLNVFIYDPHGYGKSEGTPTKSNFLADAFAAYFHMTSMMRIHPGKIILLGQSLGGVPSLRIANSEPVAGLILEGTFTSIRQMARDRYPLLPVWLLASSDFDNAREIQRLKIPVLIINGSEDLTIAPYHSQRLFDIAPKPSEYIRIEGAGHTTMFEIAPDIYYGAIARFVQSVTSRPNH